MPRWIPQPAMPLVFCCVLAGLGSCASQSSMHSSLSATIGGRDVEASMDAPASMSQENGAAVLTFRGHELVVERERVLLDSREIGTVPLESKKIVVVHAGGKLTVTADGEPALEVMLE